MLTGVSIGADPDTGADSDTLDTQAGPGWPRDHRAELAVLAVAVVARLLYPWMPPYAARPRRPVRSPRSGTAIPGR